ncbi:MAG: hypothetical protein ACRCXB_04290 [Aeromonadaceae bacterium]
MNQFLTLVLGVLAGAACFWAATPHFIPVNCDVPSIEVPIKLSVNGICHTPESQYFNGIKHYTPYDSLSECITDGGRFPANQ